METVLGLIALFLAGIIAGMINSVAGGGSFLAWQLFRRPNHSFTFYPLVVPVAIGLAVCGIAAANFCPGIKPIPQHFIQVGLNVIFGAVFLNFQKRNGCSWQQT